MLQSTFASKNATKFGYMFEASLMIGSIVKGWAGSDANLNFQMRWPNELIVHILFGGCKPWLSQTDDLKLILVPAYLGVIKIGQRAVE